MPLPSTIARSRPFAFRTCILPAAVLALAQGCGRTNLDDFVNGALGDDGSAGDPQLLDASADGDATSAPTSPPDAAGDAAVDGPATGPADAGSDAFACDADAGFVQVGGACVAAPAPRLIAPLSTARVTSRRPTFRWALSGATDGAHVDICFDRACNSVVDSFDAAGTSGRPALKLPPGVLFWRAFGRSGAVTGTQSTPVWEFTVGHRSGRANTSWGSVLDANGDGYADVFVGQREVGTGARGTVGIGHGFVYIGGPGGIGTSPATTLASPGGTGSEFGTSVTSGDFDGDGYPDVLLGMPGTGSAAGGAAVYPGGPDGLATSPSATLAGTGTFGSVVAGAGDINGDGYADAIVGAPDVRGGPYNFAGLADVFFGSPNGLSASSSTTLSPPASGEFFGNAIGALGDVNGDGYADIVVAGNPARSSDAGGVYLSPYLYVYMGGPNGLQPPIGLASDPHNYQFAGGVTFATPCDVNGDGYADLVAGSEGGFIVYFGSASGLDASAPATFTVPGLNEYTYSFRVACAGDADGDGYDDVVAAYDSLYVYRGSASGLPANPSQTFTPPNGSAGIYGYEVSPGGDVNGDGYDDFVAGAPFDSNWIGRAYLFDGDSQGLATAPVTTLTGAGASGAQYGSAVE